MNKSREHFEHELSTSNIPYKELADENTLNVWFEQFCNAPKIPSLWLYRLQHLNEEEYVDAIENNRTLLQRIQDGFYDHQIQRTLDKRYYINSITQTPISKVLNKIKKTREIFLDSIYDNSTDRYKEPKDTSDIIIEQLERLPLSFASAIIQDIQEDDANMHVFIIKEFGDRELSQAEKNKLEKMNNSLIQLLRDWEKSKNNETQKEKYNESTEKKYPAKYYALLHWIKIELGLEEPFELNSEGRYSKESIREFARNKYPNISNQQFYKEFKDLDITNKAYIATIFGRDYKEILIKISGNNAKIIRHLKDFPN